MTRTDLAHACYLPRHVYEQLGDARKAVQVARRFHEFVKRLYVPRHAEIRYGPGGEQVKEWPRSYRPGVFQKVWKNAGVWRSGSPR